MKVIFEDEKHVAPDGTMWHLTVYDEMILNHENVLVNMHSIGRVQTPEEIQEQQLADQKQARINELKELIGNKKLLDMDCTAEQAELRDLLSL